MCLYTYDTSIPYDMLKSYISCLVYNPFNYKDGTTRYTNVQIKGSVGQFTNSLTIGEKNECASAVLQNF